MAQTKPDEVAEKAPAPPTPFAPTWTRDPWVVVSKRARQVYFPTTALLKEPTEAERVSLRQAADVGRPQRPTSLLQVLAGVNFLGAYTSAWALRDVANPQDERLRRPPSDADCRLFWLYSNATQTIRQAPEFKGRDSAGNLDHRQTDANRVSDGWRRVLRYLETQEKQDLEEAGGFLSGALFHAQQGFDAPELIVLPLSEVLTMRTVLGQQAAAYLPKAAEHAREGLHLGALHDYAARLPIGTSVRDACRARLVVRPNLAA